MAVIAVLDTGHFTFHGLGRDHKHAERVMLEAMKVHARVMGLKYRQFKEDYADGVNYVEVEVGSAVRDYGFEVVSGVA
jgi:hypothetical protein